MPVICDSAILVLPCHCLRSLHNAHSDCLPARTSARSVFDNSPCPSLQCLFRKRQRPARSGDLAERPAGKHQGTGRFHPARARAGWSVGGVFIMLPFALVRFSSSGLWPPTWRHPGPYSAFSDLLPIVLFVAFCLLVVLPQVTSRVFLLCRRW